MCTSDIGEKYCRKYRSLSFCFIFYVKDNSWIQLLKQLFILFFWFRCRDCTMKQGRGHAARIKEHRGRSKSFNTDQSKVGQVYWRRSEWMRKWFSQWKLITVVNLVRPALHFRAKKAKFSGCQSKKSSCSFLTNSDMMFQGKEAKKWSTYLIARRSLEMIKNVLKIVFRNYSNKKKKNRWYKQTDKIRANKIISNFTSQGKPDKTWLDSKVNCLLKFRKIIQISFAK